MQDPHRPGRAPARHVSQRVSHRRARASARDTRYHDVTLSFALPLEWEDLSEVVTSATAHQSAQPRRSDGDARGVTVKVDLGRGDENDVAADMVFPLGWREWRGEMLPVPRAVEDVLEYRYGPTWRVPRYLDKGRDTFESKKLYFKLLR